MDLIDKEKILKENIKDIAQLDEGLLLIDEQYIGLLSERKKIEENQTRKEVKSEANLIASWNKMDLNRNVDKNGAHTDTEKHQIEQNGNDTTSQTGKYCVHIHIMAFHCLRIPKQNDFHTFPLLYPLHMHRIDAKL